MRCPVDPSHKLMEVAAGLYQCSCGGGPDWFWALSDVTVRGDGLIEALCCATRAGRGDVYTLSDVS